MFYLYYYIVTKMYDYVFSENGLVAYKSGELLAIQVNYMTHMCTIIFNCNCRTLRKQWEKKRSKLLLTFVSITWQT